ncbi:MAG TPA: hypothetical protein VFF80_02345 [Bacillota bacterium]|nr:hypothetical protein [Bacillota bacterium]
MLSGKIAQVAIEKNHLALEALSLEIWNNPEGPFAEFIASKAIAVFGSKG